jgi:hypothetical protein
MDLDQLEHDDPPGNHREENQQQQNSFNNQTGAGKKCFQAHGK